MDKLLAKAGCCYDGYTAFKFIKRCLWRKEKLLKIKKNKKKENENNRKTNCIHSRTLDQGR